MNWRQLLIIPPLLAGIALFLWMVREEGGGQEAAPSEAVLAVRVAEVTATPFRPAVSGYGRVAATSSWSAISQVQGRAVEVNPELSPGRVVTEGDLLVAIDPRDYEIALAKVEAARDSARASLRELDATEANTRATLKLEQRIEAYLQAEFDRQSNLLERGSVSQSVVDQATRTLLAQQKAVLELQNRLNLLPVQREIHQTTLATRSAEIEEAGRSLERTRIVAPLTGRVTRKSVTHGQFVRTGDNLLTVESIDAAEILAEFRPRALRNFFRIVIGDRLPTLVIRQDLKGAFEIIRGLGLVVTVHPTNNERYFWPAELMRFSGRADAQTGALGMVAQVENPFLPEPVSRRPPLVNGTFVEVRLSAPEPAEVIRIERNALRTDPDGVDFVFLVDEDSRLARRDVVAGPVAGDRVVVLSGLDEGDRVVLSDPQPAVYGMLLAPVTK